MYTNVRCVLHPTDFSELSDHAFRFACNLALDYHAPLHVLHVATPFEAYKGERVFDEHPEQYLAKDWEKLERYQCAGVEIHRAIKEGEPAEQIVRAAKEIGCDFIVMGCVGRSGLPRLLLGSVAEHVLRGADCQVIIVKQPVAGRKSDPADAGTSSAITSQPPA